MEHNEDIFSIDYAIEHEIAKSEKIMEQIKASNELGYTYATDILKDVAKQHTLKADWLNRYKHIMEENKECVYDINNEINTMAFIDTGCGKKIRSNRQQLSSWSFCPFCSNAIIVREVCGDVERT